MHPLVSPGGYPCTGRSCKHLKSLGFAPHVSLSRRVSRRSTPAFRCASARRTDCKPERPKDETSTLRPRSCHKAYRSRAWRTGKQPKKVPPLLGHAKAQQSASSMNRLREPCNECAALCAGPESPAELPLGRRAGQVGPSVAGERCRRGPILGGWRSSSRRPGCAGVAARRSRRAALVVLHA